MIEIDEKAFTDALNHVASTAEGKIILACLKEYCRFDGDILVENSTENTYANATLRRAYLYFRKRLKPEYLKTIEYDYRRKVTTNDRPNTNTTRPRRKAGVSST
jgi:hypothetical protein